MKDAVEFRNISKHFPGVRVLNNVTLSIRKGEVHALLGENGAGKSTLLNILHGVYSEYSGDVFLDGQKVCFRNPHEAIADGKISKVHQETNIIRDMTVGQNVALGYEPRKGAFVNYPELNQTVNQILKRLKCRFRGEDSAAILTAGEMQMVAIAKALFHKANVISLDEPTASLTIPETDALFQIIQELKAAGMTIIYVSHRLEEVFRICDRATILRDGDCVATLEVAETTREEIIRYMVGRNVSAIASRLQERRAQPEKVLEVKHLSCAGKFSDVSFYLRKGEILGFSGLVGAGRTEVMRTVFGADRASGGEVLIHGRPARIRSSQDALRCGIGLLPEERKTQGFNTFFDNTGNIALASLKRFLRLGFVQEDRKLSNCKKFMKTLNINPPRPDFLTRNMSGGNQQKVILAKWLSTDVEILIFDEPTKGVDVAAKAEIYRLLEELVAQGKSVIVVSSELPEVMGISDRIYVMCEGQITAELEPADFKEELLLNYAMGGKDHAEN
ncbi:MAG: sugar ABC transporter ATP-binding protein [Clostridiales bacterium]|nr:sugar ABC transporter ATP-binding protein [Clostridiales bacterium]